MTSERENNALPPVSVIMAAYNEEKYIAEAVESVLGQTHQDFELIVVDDGSTDRTREILEEYAARDGRVRVISQENSDQPASLNRALEAARHEWVALFDADDVCLPHRLETQLRELRREPGLRVIGSYAIWLDQYGRKRGTRALGPTSVAEFEKIVEQDGQVIIIHPSAMMHRPTILALGGYDPDFGAAADVELWSRISDKHAIVCLPEPLIFYRFHPASMTVTRFFEQRVMLRWIQVRQTARRRGLSPPGLGEFGRLQGGWFTSRRLDHFRRDWGLYLIMRSTIEWRKGCRLRALLIRAAAAALTPVEATNRLLRAPFLQDARMESPGD